MKSFFLNTRSAFLVLGGAAVLVGAAPLRSAAQDIFVAERNIVVSGSGGASPSITFDVYISGSTTYVTTALNPLVNPGPAYPKSLNNVDIAFDVDFGTGGTAAVNTSTPIGYTTGTSNLIFNVSGITSVANTVTPSGLSGVMPAGYDSRFKMNMDRTTSNTEISLIPVKAFTLQVTFPAGTAIDQTTGLLRLRTTVGGTGSKWGSNDATTINAPIGPSANQVTPLPVELLDFSAIKASDGRRSQLDWTTATETGSAYFEIERSATGAAGSFASIGVKADAAGTSTSKLTYQRYDPSPLVGMNYYRLKIVELSGKMQYSDVRSVRFEGVAAGESVSFYPNPLSGASAGATGLKVSVDADQSLSYTLSDASGKLVGGGSLEVLKGTGSYPLEGFEALSAGTYYLSIKGATLNTTLKISKTE